MTLASLRQQSWNIRAIAELLGRSPSAISRELRRNSTDGGYSSAATQASSCQPRIDARPWPRLHAHSML